MNKIKRMLKRWLGINYLIDLCDERDICVNKRITEERERFNKLFHSNKFTINNAVKKYDKMLDDINDKIQSPYDKDGMFKDEEDKKQIIDDLLYKHNEHLQVLLDEEYKKNKHFKECAILKINALLEYINLHNEGGCNND